MVIFQASFHFHHLVEIIVAMSLNNVLKVMYRKNAFFYGVFGIFLLSTAALKLDLINFLGISVAKSHGQELSHNEKLSSLCIERVLSKDNIAVFQWERIDQDVMPLIQKNNECRLHFYNKLDMVTCIDTLTSLNNNNTHGAEHDEHADRLISANFIALEKYSKTNGNIKLHMAFLGDSRIHQIFMNFVLQMVPFFEDGCSKLIEDGKYRYDKCMSVPILDALFSYHSLATYDNTYMEVVKGMLQGKAIAPNYLVIGSTAHHALKFHREGGLMPEFNGNITELAILLNQLEERYGTRMIWWKDELVPRKGNHNHFTVSLNKLNKIAIKIFQKYKVNIEIWNSTNDLFMTYLKLCDAWDIERQSNWSSPPLISHPNSWLKCNDIFHAPQSYATIQAQLLANDLCNHVMQIYYA